MKANTAMSKIIRLASLIIISSFIRSTIFAQECCCSEWKDPEPIRVLSSGQQEARDPVIGTASNNNIFLVFEEEQTIWSAYYDQNTGKWQNKIAISGELGIPQSAKPDEAFPSDIVVAAWADKEPGNDKNEIFWSRFDGLSWSSSTTIPGSLGAVTPPKLAALCPHCDADARVIALWIKGDGGKRNIAGSIYDGTSWSPTDTIPGSANTGDSFDISSGREYCDVPITSTITVAVWENAPEVKGLSAAIYNEAVTNWATGWSTPESLSTQGVTPRVIVWNDKAIATWIQGGQDKGLYAKVYEGGSWEGVTKISGDASNIQQGSRYDLSFHNDSCLVVWNESNKQGIYWALYTGDSWVKTGELVPGSSTQTNANPAVRFCCPGDFAQAVWEGKQVSGNDKVLFFSCFDLENQEWDTAAEIQGSGKNAELPALTIDRGNVPFIGWLKQPLTDDPGPTGVQRVWVANCISEGPTPPDGNGDGNGPVPPPVTPVPPSNIRACQTCHRLPTRGILINILCWDPVPGAIAYNVYGNAEKTCFLEEIPALATTCDPNTPIVFQHRVCPGVRTTYYITTITLEGESSEVAVTVP